MTPILFLLYARAALAWTKKKHSLRKERKAEEQARKRQSKKENQKSTRGKEKVVGNRRPRETAPGHSQKTEARG